MYSAATLSICVDKRLTKAEQLRVCAFYCNERSGNCLWLFTCTVLRVLHPQ